LHTPQRRRFIALELAGLRPVANRMEASPRTGRRRASRPSADLFPGFVEPCLASLRAKAPEGSDWIHEIKFDGYRTQLHLRDGRVRALTRRGHDWTRKFAPIAKAIEALGAESLIVDGETIVAGPEGVPDFGALHADLARGRTDRLNFYAFDLIYLDGRDLRKLPLIERKEKLRALLEGAPALLQYSDHFETNGADLFKSACAMGLEGVISKLRQAPYRSGQGESWIKTKCVLRDNFPIVAFVEKLEARPRRIALLYIGRRDDDRLLYAGKAQSGFKDADLYMLRERLDPFIRRTSPLSMPVKKPKATWVEPVIEAEIAYNGVTADGLLRAPVFKAIRADLSAEPPSGARRAAKSSPRASADAASEKTGRVPRDNILQLLPDAVAPSPHELTRYWRKAAKRALVHLARRPLKLVRRAGAVVFYHKGPLPPVPEAMHQLRIEKREGGEGVRLWVDHLDGLLGLVEMGAVELHPWNATIDDLEHPDMLVFDLDPGEGVAWSFVTDTALKLRDMLAEADLECWPKVTGGKGLHIMAPIEPDMDHDQAREYCRALSARLAATDPGRYTISSAPIQRKGRIFIDYLRNGRGTTAIGAYSPRARKGSPIAAPVRWADVERGVRADAFSLTHLPSSRAK
jgi:bifunctional non-homologous end joining protein LigD